MKTTYRYIIRYPDGTCADVIADNLKSLLVSAYNQVRNRPDEKAYQKQIKSNIDAVREAHAFYIKCNKELAKEKASRQKAIELAAKTNATSNQIDNRCLDANASLEEVLAIKRAPGDKPRSKDYAYMKAWRAKRKAGLAAMEAAGIKPKKKTKAKK